MKRKLALYVWNDVLKDYTPGMAVAIAASKGEAAVVAAGASHTVLEELLAADCDVIPLNKPWGTYIHGGG